MTDNSSSTEPPAAQSVSRPVIAGILAFGALLAAYGVAQPLVLRQLGETGGENLSTADAISVLVTVVSIVVAVLGFGIYLSIRDRMRNDARREIAHVERRWRDEIALGVARSWLNQAALCWQQIEPLVVTPPETDLEQERLVSLVYAGISVSNQTLEYIRRMQDGGHAGEGLRRLEEEARVSLGFFSATLAKLGGVSPEDRAVLREDVRRQLPSLESSWPAGRTWRSSSPTRWSSRSPSVGPSCAAASRAALPGTRPPPPSAGSWRASACRPRRRGLATGRRSAPAASPGDGGTPGPPPGAGPRPGRRRRRSGDPGLVARREGRRAEPLHGASIVRARPT